VAALDIDAERAEECAETSRTQGAPASIGLGCDVRDEASVREAIENASKTLGPIRGLVTSAGIDRSSLVHEMKLDHWREVIDVNLTGTFLSCKHVLAHMLKHAQGGSIVCVSSAWGNQ
jgi:NAD(P)-dependent dehydrogenase (short-subunit alcohol dehydrogenase family)